MECNMCQIFKYLIFISLVSLTHCENNSTTINQNIKLETCGEAPAVARDCFIFDTNTSSCCFYSFVDKKGCVALGKRYKGSTYYGSLYLECGDNFSKIAPWIVIIFTIFILL